MKLIDKSKVLGQRPFCLRQAMLETHLAKEEVLPTLIEPGLRIHIMLVTPEKRRQSGDVLDVTQADLILAVALLDRGVAGVRLRVGWVSGSSK